MSLIIKSVELKNIKAHEYFLFEPAINGITAISGENGAGKSTIVDSLAWSLFGTRPSGIRNKNLIREKVDPKEKPVSVKSIILIGGLEYAVERKILNKEGTTECNVYGKVVGANEYKHVAGPSVTHVEKFIRNELGMNEKGFLTSIFVQQKQVDQIVSASPRERGFVIEELTGISIITQAITKKNETTRELEKAASVFHTGNLDEAIEKVEKQEQICETYSQKEQDAILKFKQTKQEFQESSKNLEIEGKKVKERISLTQQIESLNVQIDLSKKQAKDDLNYIVEFKNKYGTTIVIDTKNLKEKVEDARKKLQSFEYDYNNKNKELESISLNLKSCNTLKGHFESEEEIEELIKKKENENEDLQKQKETQTAKESMLTSEIKHSKKAKEHITGEHKNCPVCKSDIEDPAELKNQIEEDIKNFEKEKSETKILIKETNEKIKLSEDTLKSLKISLEAIKEHKRLTSAEKDLKKTLKSKREELEIMKMNLKTLEEEYDKALRVEADKKALDAAKARSLTINQTIEEKENQAKSLKEKISTLNALSDRSYSALEKRTQELREKVGKMSVYGQEIMGRKKLELERLEDYKKNLEKVKEAMEKYNQLAKEIKISSSASGVLSTFKADRIEDSIPTLEFYASDFLFKFTNGEFAKLSIDKKFNTFVTTSEGHVRPVSHLSGGELSAAAIALRLGIAMFMSSSEKSTLILDEVLVSMDEDRARQIMETISSMTSSQVIFIAHNSDINSIADKTVTVSK